MTVNVLQAGIFSALGGYPGLSALVGSRVYPDLAPQEVAKPYVVWQEVSTVDEGNSIAGSVATGGLDNCRIQVTAWANGPNGATIARNVADQVRLAMIAASGFKSLRVDARALPFEPDTKMYGFQADYSVWLRT